MIMKKHRFGGVFYLQIYPQTIMPLALHLIHRFAVPLPQGEGKRAPRFSATLFVGGDVLDAPKYHAYNFEDEM